ncbi:Carbohydrate esterase 4 protein [Tulasnella sp. 403]|nr:Carbohydrate esterase 4 protein [Tulasnella sp. 403]
MFSLTRLFATALAVSTLVSALPAPDIAQRDYDDEIKPPRARVINSCFKKDVVALTFDDGPTEFTKHIVSVLARHNANGTFFVSGAAGNITNDVNSRNLKAAFDAGHQIASKGFSNQDWTNLSESELKDDLEKLDDALKQIIGHVPRFVRPPKGVYNDQVRSVVYKNKQSIVLWDFDSHDDSLTPYKSEQQYVKLAEAKPKNALTLNHEILATSKQILSSALKTLEKAGYKFVTVADCLGEKAYQ